MFTLYYIKFYILLFIILYKKIKRHNLNFYQFLKYITYNLKEKI